MLREQQNFERQQNNVFVMGIITRIGLMFFGILALIFTYNLFMQILKNPPPTENYMLIPILLGIGSFGSIATAILLPDNPPKHTNPDESKKT